MKAPDKIYANVNERGFVCGYDEPMKQDDVVYIRKDALLKWAVEQLSENMGQYHEDYDLAFNALIDKLNSL